MLAHLVAAADIPLDQLLQFHKIATFPVIQVAFHSFDSKPPVAITSRCPFPGLVMA
jgi:hypothetical protein